MLLLLGGGIVVILLGLYLWHVERGLAGWPPEAEELSPHRWTDEEIKQAYHRIAYNPIDFTPHLPPKRDRRYVVVGGSGLVGGHIILHLLARGQPSEAIRNVDFMAPRRDDLRQGRAAEVGFIRTDITSEASVRAAFSAPWPDSVAHLPLTVFHIAAVIRPQDRARIVYSLVSRVNVVGTANVLSAAKAAGADVFIATSSGSIAIRPLDIWIPPWRRYPKNLLQAFPDPDKDTTIRPHGDYFGNYAESKAHAEVLVLDANTEVFRTGCIRPACGIYGNKYDLTVGILLAMRVVPSWFPHLIHDFIHGENASLAHLLYENAVLTHPKTTAGRAFLVSDPGQPPTFGDVYHLLNVCTGFKAPIIPAMPILLIAPILEAYTLLRAYVPQLGRVLPALQGNTAKIAPSLFSISGTHQIGNNEPAGRQPEDGGIGYKGVCTTLEGMVAEAKAWNDDPANAKYLHLSKLSTMAKEVKNVVKMPSTVMA